MREVIVALFLGIVIAGGAAAQTYGRSIPTRDERYTYLAHITRVIDGDTVEAEIDLGFNVWRRNERYRLSRIDAPEKRGKTKIAGKKAAAWLKGKIEGKWLIIRTIANRKGNSSSGKFGRYLIEVFLDGKNINDELVRNGMAVYRKY